MTAMEGQASSSRKRAVRGAIVLALAVVGPVAALIGWERAMGVAAPAGSAEEVLAGSSSCRDCHEHFYELWSTSHHGLAMQPYTAEFASANLSSQDEPVQIGEYSYRADVEAGEIVESGPGGEKRYEMVHVLGGKYIYYFLTQLERGRLQTLPLAYDVKDRQWFDTAASSVRHFLETSDAPVHWTDPLYTFNTSCHDCHVSQLASNYDAATDTYQTQWAEPGINCEVCHGPAQQHVEIYRRAQASGEKPAELGLISTRAFSVDQTNAMCNICHAKLTPVTTSFVPGERYFDHFGLVGLEDPDFYPDGRDLGENYTMTLWRMSECVKSGQLDCMHCHTSSGRYRFTEAGEENGACLPCHEQQATDLAKHSRHEPGAGAPTCVSCHMPTTEFAHMERTDHSMRPPVPAATQRYGSPNACNLCHQDRDAAWAQGQVVQWGKDGGQSEYLRQADYVAQARGEDWRDLDGMLAYLGESDRDEIIAGSLVRLLARCGSDKKWPVLIRLLRQDSSPFVRGAAAEVLDGYLTQESFAALLEAAGDEFRLVRIRAAAALAPVPAEQLGRGHRQNVERATEELMASFEAFPDSYTSHYNQGNIRAKRGEHREALDSYRTAVRLRPDFAAAHVNAAFAFNAVGENGKAEESFRAALQQDPNNATINLNLGMLLGEMKRLPEAEQAFRRALSIEPAMAGAAYNLGLLLARSGNSEWAKWSRRAYTLEPQEGRYGYTYAYLLHKAGDTEAAVAVLTELIARSVPHADAYALLGSIYLDRREPDKALGVYREAQLNQALLPEERQAFGAMLQRLE